MSYVQSLRLKLFKYSPKPGLHCRVRISPASQRGVGNFFLLNFQPLERRIISPRNQLSSITKQCRNLSDEYVAIRIIFIWRFYFLATNTRFFFIIDWYFACPRVAPCWYGRRRPALLVESRPPLPWLLWASISLSTTPLSTVVITSLFELPFPKRHRQEDGSEAIQTALGQTR